MSDNLLERIKRAFIGKYNIDVYEKRKKVDDFSANERFLYYKRSSEID